MFALLKTRIEAQVPVLAGRVEGAADLAELTRKGAWPQASPAAHLIPLGLQGLGAYSATGAFTQILREMVSVVLTLRTYDRAAGDDLPELHELIQAVLQAVAGWGPDGSVGVFELARGSLIHNRDGRLVYQLDFAIDDQLRILA